MCTLAYRNDDFDNLVFLIGAFGRCDDVFFGCNATNLKTVSVDPLQKRYIAVDHIAVFPHVNCSSGQETSERSNAPAGGSFFRRILCRFGRSRTCRIFVDTNPQLQIAIFQNELFQQIVVIRCNGCAGAVESGCLTLVPCACGWRTASSREFLPGTYWSADMYRRLLHRDLSFEAGRLSGAGR